MRCENLTYLHVSFDIHVHMYHTCGFNVEHGVLDSVCGLLLCKCLVSETPMWVSVVWVMVGVMDFIVGYSGVVFGVWDFCVS